MKLFQSYFMFLHHSVLAKLATSSIRVKFLGVCIVCSYSGLCGIELELEVLFVLPLLPSYF